MLHIENLVTQLQVADFETLAMKCIYDVWLMMWLQRLITMPKGPQQWLWHLQGPFWEANNFKHPAALLGCRPWPPRNPIYSELQLPLNANVGGEPNHGHGNLGVDRRWQQLLTVIMLCFSCNRKQAPLTKTIIRLRDLFHNWLEIKQQPVANAFVVCVRVRRVSTSLSKCFSSRGTTRRG